MQEIALSNVEDFNYDVVSPDSSKVLKALSEQLDGVYKNYQVIVGEIFYKAQQELSSYGDGLFSKWVESQGFSRTNAYNYINSYKFVQNLNKPKKEIFDSVPKSLQFEMAKNSALEDANQAVFNGDVTTHKEYKELERRLKLKDQALEAVKGELERVKQTKTTEKVIEKEVIPQDYQATQDLNKQLLGKNQDLSDELDSVKRSLRLKTASYEMLEKETSEAIALKESIEHLRADKEKLENSVSNIFTLSNLVSEFEDFFDSKMAPLRFKTLIQGIGKDAQIEKLRDILTLTENWLDEMNKIVPENGRTIIEGEIINE
ncbi:CT583 family protein [Streptococcus salivarius]|jgi:hypothetical protein|uniref:CT583 family protein n=1 Tax=Streptococcus salivarius TaxID=1304 RepID=UPI00189B2560|nr:CT583 family protein [Streptococcus salivarius]DAS60688.1 MAG TPA: Protein of unknown function (DUF3102) [Caudoviricetes sp.]